MSMQSPITQVEEATRSFVLRVYNWMTAGLLITGGVAWYVAGSQTLLTAIYSSPWSLIGLIIGQLVLVFALSRWARSLSPVTAAAAFIVYSVLTGLMFSVIFLVYAEASIAQAFLITAGTFAAMSVYGYTTRTDLTRAGSFAFMALIGLIIASVVNLFLRNPTLYWIISYAGVLIFVVLTAYDTQKIKNMSAEVQGTEVETQMAIYGALVLYLDFINLFLMILRILGRRR